LVQFIYYLSPVVINAPLFVLWIIGIIVALTTRRRHPQVSLLAAVALAIQLSETAVVLVVYPWISQVVTSGWPAEKINVFWMASTFVRVFLSTIAWLLILLAIFKYRHQQSRILGHDGHYLPEGFDPGATATVQRGDGDVLYRPHP